MAADRRERGAVGCAAAVREGAGGRNGNLINFFSQLLALHERMFGKSLGSSEC